MTYGSLIIGSTVCSTHLNLFRLDVCLEPDPFYIQQCLYLRRGTGLCGATSFTFGLLILLIIWLRLLLSFGFSFLCSLSPLPSLLLFSPLRLLLRISPSIGAGTPIIQPIGHLREWYCGHRLSLDHNILHVGFYQVLIQRIIQEIGIPSNSPVARQQLAEGKQQCPDIHKHNTHCRRDLPSPVETWANDSAAPTHQRPEVVQGAAEIDVRHDLLDQFVDFHVPDVGFMRGEGQVGGDLHWVDWGDQKEDQERYVQQGFRHEFKLINKMGWICGEGTLLSEMGFQG